MTAQTFSHAEQNLVRILAAQTGGKNPTGLLTIEQIADMLGPDHSGQPRKISSVKSNVSALKKHMADLSINFHNFGGLNLQYLVGRRGRTSSGMPVTDFMAQIQGLFSTNDADDVDDVDDVDDAGDDN
jgi:hypothetical protein